MPGYFQQCGLQIGAVRSLNRIAFSGVRGAGKKGRLGTSHARASVDGRRPTGRKMRHLVSPLDPFENKTHLLSSPLSWKPGLMQYSPTFSVRLVCHTRRALDYTLTSIKQSVIINYIFNSSINMKLESRG